jgi:LysR family glycine cleavage system transcriptional activator
MARPNHPLNALRAFEAAARLGSYIAASNELNVTPAAVSHLVKKLELYLDTPLFRRLPRGLLLTDAGQALWSDLRDVFQDLDNAMDRVLATRSRSAVTISVAPVFATKWLFPRLPRFNAVHPDIDLRLSTSLEPVDLQRDGFDAAIRLGDGRYPGLKTDLLFDETVTPMISPRLLGEAGPIDGPDDLARFTLMHNDSMAADPNAPSWTLWLKAAGATNVDAARGPRFGQPDYAMQAAIDGAGVVLGRRQLAADDLAAGRLVAPFPLALPLGRTFYLVHRLRSSNNRHVMAFRAWLLNEIPA